MPTTLLRRMAGPRDRRSRAWRRLPRNSSGAAREPGLFPDAGAAAPATRTSSERSKDALGDRIAGVYSSLPAAFTVARRVWRGMSKRRDLGCDVLVSIGGGSNIDAAKIDSILSDAGRVRDGRGACLARRQGECEASRERSSTSACRPRFRAPSSPISPAGAIRARCSRTPSRCPIMLPRTLILDQALATRTPLQLWLSSGLRAIDHAIEALCSGRNHPLGETLALEGVARMRAGLNATSGGPCRSRRTADQPVRRLVLLGSVGDRRADGGEPRDRSRHR